MGKLSGKMRNAVTQRYADARFDQEEIMRRSQTEHNGEPMMRIYQRIMTDPSIRQEATKNHGRYDLVYRTGDKEAVVGWIDHDKGMGEIAQKAYDHVQDLTSDGCYVVREKDAYAVKVYAGEVQGQYLVSGGTECTFSETEKTVFDTYESAASASRSASVQLGLLPGYDTPEQDLDDVPHAAQEGDGIYRAHPSDQFGETQVSDDFEMGD